MRRTIKASAGREFGHCPGHQYLDVKLEASGGCATLTITWGSAQGYDEEHRRTEYTRRGASVEDAIDRVRDAALAEETDEETRRYIETASSRALTRRAA